MHAATTSSSSLAARITNPSPAARQARAELRRSRACQRAGAELRKMQARIAALAHDQRELQELLEIAQSAAPNKTDEAAWPVDIRELADKIERQQYGGIRSFEQPVRDRDRQIVLSGLPPCVEVSRNDDTLCRR